MRLERPSLARPGLALLLAAALAGCAGPGADRLGQAAVTPLNDLNLVQAPIPPLLAEARLAPYRLPASQACSALLQEVRALDELLGADLDAPPSQRDAGLIERGGQAAGDAAAQALQGAAEGVVPFRGWVRKLSGAERYSREVAAAIAAGTVRRGFLKGLRAAQGCP